ncbi:MAG TPA: RNA polymerase factor sigma-32 [Vitreimonas sp.]|uniref:RNA polymerase factor sigma-32 n=1 Tax=Vitreimonas sp. TaxID=3069702 RepID=UPI002D2F9B34|nr:RNA polymerase factor sigma-32 [Vitreimonas sp.]HYD88675.1 RNA polymerase factor sigma-32 [Vitreimonas sp.]
MALTETSELRRGAQSYLRTAMRAPLLDAMHERELARRWRDEGDERALHKLITAYLRLVVAMASRFRHYGLPMSDLVQEGNVGLMQAAARFEPEREVRFSTYASWWIRSAMQDFVLRNWSIVRTGTTSAQKALFFNLRRLRAKIGDVGDAVMSAEASSRVALALRVPEREVEAMAARLSAPDRSLNAPLTEEGDGEWQDLLADESDSPELMVMQAHDGAARVSLVHQALRELSARERLIIQERKLEDEAVTLEALGERLGISKERVRQIEGNALEKLRRALIARVGDPVEAGYVG